ncbi:MAG TPA: potassium-transporting ATPase subunit KdpC [Candidatus Binataceae bacterium]
MRTLIIAIRMTIVLTVLTGLVYPIVMTGISLALLPHQARGSLIVRNARVIGSSLIGQNFSAPGYFHSRPSAAGDKGYDASASSGSNLGPTNKALIEAVKSRLKGVMEENPGTTAAEVPIDLVTTSGSGLDPEVSPAAAQLQVPRVAKARGMGEEQVRKLVQQATRGRWMGILGEPGVNVLQLNLALDEAAPAARQAQR